MKKGTYKQNLLELKKYRKSYLKQKQFPAFPRPHEDSMIPIMHTGYLLFIRSKFLYLGFLKTLELKNSYASYSLIKSYWENVAAFGYYYLRISRFLRESNKEEAFKLSMKIGLGGRGFVTQEMIEKKGEKLENFTLPNILTMMELVDKDLKKLVNRDITIFRELYDEQVAEGGHTTYIGLSIALRKLRDGSMLPDVKKGWDRFENSSVVNLAILSSVVFFYYRDRFLELKDKY